ncbi:hypothetical protein GCM10012275_46580 [Longimycelium tulufanense]|uniref:Uncharacterized protein n=1 Tax=Longimycelium tulufanense TaxID=907463 RepID=A0A8J3FX07_9PSEU|nr:hypothetical protein [Longimycelium tulufanense]GGM70827.1 hypothetical protein GCM10012275_46580 [Longimycelium tulufanense]
MNTESDLERNVADAVANEAIKSMLRAHGELVDGNEVQIVLITRTVSPDGDNDDEGVARYVHWYPNGSIDPGTKIRMLSVALHNVTQGLDTP